MLLDVATLLRTNCRRQEIGDINNTLRLSSARTGVGPEWRLIKVITFWRFCFSGIGCGGGFP